MSEEYIRWLLTGFVALVAWEIRALRKDIKFFVKREDCRHDMDDHHDRLDELDERITKNENTIAWLMAKIEVWHEKN